MDKKLIQDARRVIDMLERLSADSVWAHRASGLRGSLIKALELVETSQACPLDLAELDRLVQAGLDLLTKAAREIRAQSR
jgi:hypothetical protein